MTYRSAVIDRMFIVRWKEPTMADVDKVYGEIKAARARLGTPFFGVAILPLDCVPASDEVRSAMAKQLPDLLEQAESLHFVIEGSGFRQAIFRSTITTILFLSKHRGRVFVHNGFDGVVSQVRPDLTTPVHEVVHRATLLDLLTPPDKGQLRSRVS